MSNTERAPSSPFSTPAHIYAHGRDERDVADRAADLADALYVRSERRRRRESLDDLLRRTNPEIR